MSTPIRVLVDCDGVLADFVDSTLAYVYDLGGPKLDPSDIDMFNVFDKIPKEYQLRVVKYWRDDPAFIANLVPYAGAQEAVKQLQKDDNVELFYVTAPFKGSRHWMFERVQWLRQHFAATWDQIVFSNQKHIVEGAFLVDDKMDHAINWAQEHPDGHAFLWSRPWNQAYANAERPLSNVIHTNDWALLQAEVDSRLDTYYGGN